MVNNPFFGIVLSIVTYLFGQKLAAKFKSPLLNPLLVSIVLCIVILLTCNIPLESYMDGGKYITFLIGPATVALVVPLYEQLEVLKSNFKAIIIGIFAGTLASLLSMVMFVKLFHLEHALSVSIIPKAITTAIGMDLSAQFGGIPAISAAIIILTGILGAILAPPFMKLVKIKDPIAVGVCLGTASHAVGTSRAREIGELEGAMAGLCIGIAGIFTAILLPFVLILL